MSSQNSYFKMVPNLTNIKVKFGPPVHFAIIVEDKKTFQMFLKYGSSLIIKNDNGETPMENALDNKLEFVKVISYYQYQRSKQ